jgi:N-acetylneuraminic acid mutarotase
MKKKSRSRSGFLNSRTLMVLFLCAATACFIVIPIRSGLAFVRPQAPSNASQRTLTFEERVSYQRAIEEVYWRHRIWPRNRGERPDPKPSLDAVMSQAQLEKKVADYLRNSQALEGYWQRPITAEQLQAEMDRMAKHTRQSEMLQELFEALGNDPFVIAECLARPALAERLITNWYAYDQRIHGQLKQRAEAELEGHLTVEQMKQLSGKYSEIELVKSDTVHPPDHRDVEHSVKLNSREWNETVQKLARVFGDSVAAGASPTKDHVRQSLAQIKTRAVSPLQEDESRFYATAILGKATDRVKLATVSWSKESFESWIAMTENHVPTTISAHSSTYTVPKISEGGCVDDTWTATAGPPDGREGVTAVWTGTEMIIWGGEIYSVTNFNTGARYNPTTDTWTPTSAVNAPNARAYHSAVWSGQEMIIWGGRDQNFNPMNTGGRYNPETGSWVSTSNSNAPEARDSHTAVWTGSEMIVWGGGSYLNSGGRYNPDTDSWTAMSTANAPSARYHHSAIWTGNVMVVWGGFDGSDDLNTGGKYDPITDSWIATSTTNAPASRENHTAVWTGTEMIVWGGADFSLFAFYNTGGTYDPGTNSWTTTGITNAPDGRDLHTAVWTGSEMIVWGGASENLCCSDTGGRFNPATNSWTAMSPVNTPSLRRSHTAVWTGTEMIIWGGYAAPIPSMGGRYNPTIDSWTNIGTNGAPSARINHTATWTGSEMIVWGGIDEVFFNGLNTGGMYSPPTDTWAATTTINAPAARFAATAVWTGSEMIVWGGAGNSEFINTGGKYNPGTNSWTATSTVNAPIGRNEHSAVWSGSEMIVWGGWHDADLNTGGRYNPDTNTWTITSMTNTPTERHFHTAIWTGSEMVVWGGYNQFIGALDTGGRYDPEANSWTATSTVNVPTARSEHTAVWTGTEMIVFGGNAGASWNTGAKYNPSTDSWVATSDAPAGRTHHTALWTGSEMIVWGGSSDFGDSNTGGRYNPSTDSWINASMINAPSIRTAHTAVWTGNEMIVWGGGIQLETYWNSGGSYCAQSGPPPTPTPTPSITPSPTPTAIPRVTPRPRPTPRHRPTTP